MWSEPGADHPEMRVERGSGQTPPMQARVLPTRDVMGVAVTTATAAEVVADLDDRLIRGDRVKVAYLNAHTSNLAASDPGYAEVLRGFIVLNDGAGLDLASRVLHGQRFLENLNGTDFTVRYLVETSHTFRIFLLGAQPGVADIAAKAITRASPRHVIVGTRHGYFGADLPGEVASEIATSGADLVLVAMGNPVQERYIAEHFDERGCRIAFGVGALFDFLSGRVRRAPAWMRAARLEWVYRLLLEPRRLWHRYIVGNVRFVARVFASRHRGTRN
jgi:alpha-1,3-mannosyltransferase